MNNSVVQVIGNVASDIRFNTTTYGVPVASFRLAATERKFDKETSRWVDGDVNWYTVSCWRSLAENVTESINKGEPVFVIGRLNLRSWERDEKRGTTMEITAEIVGHDLARGTASFRKATRPAHEDKNGESSSAAA